MVISKLTDEMLLNNAVRLADDHRKNCEGEACNISLSLILELLRRANVKVPTKLISRFM